MVQSSHQPRDLHHPPHRQQRPADVGPRTLAGVVTDREPFVRQAEDRLEGQDDAGQADRVDLRTGDGGSPGFFLATRLLDRQRVAVLGYFAEGVTRAWSDAGLSQKLALAEVALSAAFFAAAVAFARLTRPGA